MISKVEGKGPCDIGETRRAYSEKLELEVECQKNANFCSYVEKSEDRIRPTTFQFLRWQRKLANTCRANMIAEVETQLIRFFRHNYS